jgi:excisionase family DNA binding protein
MSLRGNARINVGVDTGDRVATFSPITLSSSFSIARYLLCMSEFLSPPQAGQLVGRKRSAIIKWIHNRGLPATKLPSGQYLIQKDGFVAWLEEKGVQLPSTFGN